MTVALEAVVAQDKPVLGELLNLYLYDLSPLVDADPNAHGRFEYRWVDHYWAEPERHAFFVRADGALAGFVLVNAHTETGAQHSIAEFFILKRHRRRGIGAAAAATTFERLPGSWEVCTDVENDVAARFWRRVVSSYAAGRFQEHSSGLGSWTGPCFTFSTP